MLPKLRSISFSPPFWSRVSLFIKYNSQNKNYFSRFGKIKVYSNIISSWLYFDLYDLGILMNLLSTHSLHAKPAIEIYIQSHSGGNFEIIFLFASFCRILAALWGNPTGTINIEKNHSFMNREEGKNTEFHHHVKYLISCCLWPVARGFRLSTKIFSNQMNQMFEAFRNLERVDALCNPFFPLGLVNLQNLLKSKNIKLSNLFTVWYCFYPGNPESSGSR